MGIKNLFKVVLLMGMISSMAFYLSGCAHTMSAIEHRELTVSAKMSDTIFIDPKLISVNNKVFVKTSNTSDMQDIEFDSLLRNKLSSRGLVIVNDPSEAGYIIQANVLYMDYEKEGMTADGML
ncbi:MAG: complement resistance protein TraT, partial [Desulfatiglandales bacterium]